jgi:hypothetical protein
VRVLNPDDFASPESATSKLGKLNALLERSGIDPADFARVEKVNVWQMGYVDKEGEARSHDLAGISLIPHGWDGPEWPVVQPGPVVRLPKPGVSVNAHTGWQTCVVLPDIQIGYFRNAAGELEPTHDEAALTVALAVTKAAKPSLVVLVGDNLDLPEFGKYRLSPAFTQTTQATIDRATTLCAEVRRAAPDARIVWLAGNHEERLPNYVLDNARAAFGIRSGNTPESWPVLSAAVPVPDGRVRRRVRPRLSGVASLDHPAAEGDSR